MHQDPFVEFKARQRQMWASFAPAAVFTTPVAAHLVKFAEVQPGEAVLDVATGTGVVAITAARAGARVSALDLTPELLTEARENARIAKRPEVEWMEGDAEHLPYPDAAFDVVLSQFGHMFAPRPEVVVAEMRRVLKPNGRIAFATWPPEHLVGRVFGFVARNSPPPPQTAAPPPQWGDPTVVAARLDGRFVTPFYERGTMYVPALSIEHFRGITERSVGPLQRLIESAATQVDRLAALRAEFDALVLPYFAQNVMRQDYLLTRAAVRRPE